MSPKPVCWGRSSFPLCVQTFASCLRTNSNKKSKKTKQCGLWPQFPYLNGPNGPRENWYLLDWFLFLPTRWWFIGKMFLVVLESFQALAMPKGPQEPQPSLEMIQDKSRAKKLSFWRLGLEPHPGLSRGQNLPLLTTLRTHSGPWTSLTVVMCSFVLLNVSFLFFLYKTLWFLQKNLAKVSDSLPFRLSMPDTICSVWVYFAFLFPFIIMELRLRQGLYPYIPAHWTWNAFFFAWKIPRAMWLVELLAWWQLPRSHSLCVLSAAE